MNHPSGALGADSTFLHSTLEEKIGALGVIGGGKGKEKGTDLLDADCGRTRQRLDNNAVNIW